jgi:hypothetical protein
MLREIRNLEQRQPQRVKRWFQDDYFDLFVWQDRDGEVVQFQLCYERDTRLERALDWKRGRGFQHLKVRQRYAEALGREQSGDMSLDGVLPYVALRDRFAGAADNLAPALRDFIQDKLAEYARPARRYGRPGARTPRWLERLRRSRALDQG